MAKDGDANESHAPEQEVDFPTLQLPPGQQDVSCKFCKRSKFLTPNTTMPAAQAIATNQLTLRWRRERGNICAPCFNFQANKTTPDKFRTLKVP